MHTAHRVPIPPPAQKPIKYNNIFRLMDKQTALRQTTLRDGAQSHAANFLFAKDILELIKAFNAIGGYIALEVSGGNTPRTQIYGLYEDCFDLIKEISKITNIPLTALIRGQSMFAFNHVSDKLLDTGVKLFLESGIDIFSIFDALDDPKNLHKVIENTLTHGRHPEINLCFSLNPPFTPQYYRNKFNLIIDGLKKQYGNEIVDNLSLRIKAMGGGINSVEAYEIFKAIQDLGLPAGIHTHGGLTGALAYFGAMHAGAKWVEVGTYPLGAGRAQPCESEFLELAYSPDKRRRSTVRSISGETKTFEQLLQKVDFGNHPDLKEALYEGVFQVVEIDYNTEKIKVMTPADVGERINRLRVVEEKIRTILKRYEVVGKKFIIPSKDYFNPVEREIQIPGGASATAKELLKRAGIPQRILELTGVSCDVEQAYDILCHVLKCTNMPEKCGYGHAVTPISEMYILTNAKILETILTIIPPNKFKSHEALKSGIKKVIEEKGLDIYTTPFQPLLILYMLGGYGNPPAEINKEFRERVLSLSSRSQSAESTTYKEKCKEILKEKYGGDDRIIGCKLADLTIDELTKLFAVFGVNKNNAGNLILFLSELNPDIKDSAEQFYEAHFGKEAYEKWKQKIVERKRLITALKNFLDIYPPTSSTRKNISRIKELISGVPSTIEYDELTSCLKELLPKIYDKTKDSKLKTSINELIDIFGGICVVQGIEFENKMREYEKQLKSSTLSEVHELQDTINSKALKYYQKLAPIPLNKFNLILLCRSTIAKETADICKKLGVSVIPVVTEEDKTAPWVRGYDKVIRVGSYTNEYEIIAAIKKFAEDEKIPPDKIGVYTGWGHLGESSLFAFLCEKNGIRHSGPYSGAMLLLAHNAFYKKLAESIQPITSYREAKNGSDILELCDKVIFEAMAKEGALGHPYSLIPTADELKGKITEVSGDDEQKKVLASTIIAEAMVTHLITNKSLIFETLEKIKDIEINPETMQHLILTYVQEICEKETTRKVLEQLNPEISIIEEIEGIAKNRGIPPDEIVKLCKYDERRHIRDETRRIIDELFKYAKANNINLVTDKDWAIRELRIKRGVTGGGTGHGVFNTRDEKKILELITQCVASTNFIEGKETVSIEHNLLQEDVRGSNTSTGLQHLEVQFFVTNDGEVIILGVRNCSVQDHRYQKWIETSIGEKELEDKLTALKDKLHAKTFGQAILSGSNKEIESDIDSVYKMQNLNTMIHNINKMKGSTIKLVEGTGYRGPGTAEFLSSVSGVLYPLEINARIQVEHPVTEETTRVAGNKISIVEWQIQQLAGHDVSIDQRGVKYTRSGIEVRIYACELGMVNKIGFYGTGGKISKVTIPKKFLRDSSIRIDDAGLMELGDTPYTQTTKLDRLLMLVVVTGVSNQDAITKMVEVLRKIKIKADPTLKTNIPDLLRILKDPTFTQAYTQEGRCPSTKYLPKYAEKYYKPPKQKNEGLVTAPLAGTYYQTPKPGEPPYVKIGDVVKAGQAIGLIEAMKVFNEIQAPIDGIVTDIYIENGAEVNAGDSLINIYQSKKVI